MADGPERFKTMIVGGVPTTRISRSELANLMVDDCLKARSGALALPQVVISSNGAVIADFHLYPEFRKLVLQADIVDADGMPLVMATRLLCEEPLVERVATTDFIKDACAAAAKEGLRFFFLGAEPGVAEMAAAYFRGLYPNLEIVGIRHGYFAPEDEEKICAEVRATRTDVLWIGLGSPLQESFALRNRHRLAGLAWLRTCGGMFDHYSGKFRRAPLWMQLNGLEWLYRTFNEPVRLGRRYLSTNLPALFYLLTQTSDGPQATAKIMARQSLRALNSETREGLEKMEAPKPAMMTSRLTTSGVRNGQPRPRVAFLLTHSNAGGAQEIWANLAESFVERGYEVTLAALYPSDDSLRDVPMATPWIHVAKRRPKSPAGLFSLVRDLGRFFRENRFDVVFTALPAANVLAPIAARLAGLSTRVVTSHHSPAETHHPLLNQIDGLASSLKTVNAVISVSSTVALSHAHKPARYQSKLRTIKNALPPRIEQTVAELNALRPRDRARGRLVVAIGRLAEQKNYPVLIRALAHMPDVNVHIIGAGHDEAALKALAVNLGVSDRLTFLGFRPRPEALALLAEGDVFAQPSLFEGHSLGLIEAARIGLPLVVSDAPVQIEGITAADGEVCGIVVGVSDDKALASAICNLLDNPETYRDYAARAARLGESVTWDALLASYEALAA